MILGRPSLNTLRVVVSTPYLALNFPISATEIGVIYVDQKEAQMLSWVFEEKKGAEIEGTQEVHMVEIDQNKNMSMRDLDPREEGRVRPEPNDKAQKIQIGAVAEMFMFIRWELPEAMKAELISLSRTNSDLSPSAPKDMFRIDSRVICHRLAIDPKVRPMAQKKKKLRLEK